MLRATVPWAVLAADAEVVRLAGDGCEGSLRLQVVGRGVVVTVLKSSLQAIAVLGVEPGQAE